MVRGGCLPVTVLKEWNGNMIMNSVGVWNKRKRDPFAF